jgi:hypothetical protein
MIEKEAQQLNNKFLSSWYRDDFYPSCEVINNHKLVATVVQAFVKWASSVNMKEFHYIFSFLARRIVRFFIYTFLKTRITWLLWFYILHTIGLFLQAPEICIAHVS